MTVPPDHEHIHVFLSEQDREVALASHPAFLEKLLWGSKVLGVRVALRQARPAVVKALVRQAYDHQAAKAPVRRAGARAPAAPKRQRTGEPGA